MANNPEAEAPESSGTTGGGAIARDALYELVWAAPMLRVASRFGVSSSYMARVCTALNVPRPERGYWAKLAVGKAPPRPALPEPRPGEPLEWTRDGSPPQRVGTLPKPLRRPRRRIRTVATPGNSQHLLIEGTKAHFEAGRESYDAGYLKPAKRLLVDLTVTKNGLDRALAFANDLFLALEDRGHRVLIAPASEGFHRAEVDERETPGRQRNYNNLWTPQRCTVVYVDTVAFGLTIIETSERVEARYVNGGYVRLADHVSGGRRRATAQEWTTERDFPTGRLCLQAYSPYPRAPWQRHWREAKGQDLSQSVPKIIHRLEKATAEVARLVEEGERQAEIERQRWEAQWEQWRREEAEKRAAEAFKESRAELLEIIAAWSDAKRLEEFFADAERRAEDLPGDQRRSLVERLRRARDLIGSSNALERFQHWRAPDER